MFICLERGAVLHMAQLMPLSLALVKSRLVLPFWYRPTPVFPEKGLLNMCVRLFQKQYQSMLVLYATSRALYRCSMLLQIEPAWFVCVFWSALELSTIGGSTTEDATRRIMRTLFTTNLALQYNWTGHGSKKSAVCALQLTGVTCSELKFYTVS